MLYLLVVDNSILFVGIHPDRHREAGLSQLMAYCRDTLPHTMIRRGRSLEFGGMLLLSDATKFTSIFQKVYEDTNSCRSITHKQSELSRND
jgi:hypothetical protein